MGRSDARSEVVGCLCGSENANERLDQVATRGGLSAQFFARVCRHSEGVAVVQLVVADLCSRAASSAHERDRGIDCVR